MITVVENNPKQNERINKIWNYVRENIGVKTGLQIKLTVSSEEYIDFENTENSLSIFDIPNYLEEYKQSETELDAEEFVLNKMIDYLIK